MRTSRGLPRVYLLLIGIVAVFAALLVVLAVVGSLRPPAASVVSTPQPQAPGPSHKPCPICGLGQHCDQSTSQCVLEDTTPLPCVKGSHFDDEQGFCVPDPTAKPTPLPSRTLAPGTARPSSSPHPSGSPNGSPAGSSPKPPSTPATAEQPNPSPKA